MSDLENMFGNMIHDPTEAVMEPARQQLADRIIAADEEGEVTPEFLKALVKSSDISDEEAVKVSSLLPDGLSQQFLQACMKVNHPIKCMLGMKIRIPVTE